MRRTTAPLLVITAFVSLLSGIAVFSGRRSPAVLMELLFLVSTASALVLALRLALARLARSAGLTTEQDDREGGTRQPPERGGQ
jgi:hypothetical protein